MAIDVDWSGAEANPFRIFIPRTDLPLVQASPEIRELDVNQLRLSLRTEEATVSGAPWPDTHRHITEAVLAGFTYARLVEILPPYLVEFEDGQYVVQTTGANHNVGDRKVANQVSLVVNNSAGLINSADIQYASYENQVAVDPTSAFSGIAHPTGTRRRPVNNMADAVLIASARGLASFLVLTDLTVAGVDVAGMSFVGLNHEVIVTVEASANVSECGFSNVMLEGVFDGGVHVRDCFVLDVSNVHGHFTDCTLQGNIVLSGLGMLQIVGCTDGIVGSGVPEIDCGGSGSALIVRDYRGGLALTNKSGADPISVDLVGRVVLDNTVTGGSMIVRGVGHLELNGTTISINDGDLMNPDIVAATTLGKPLLSGMTLGASIDLIRKTMANRLEVDLGLQQLVLYDDDGITVLKRWPLETVGGELVVTHTGVQTKRKPSLI